MTKSEVRHQSIIEILRIEENSNMIHKSIFDNNLKTRVFLGILLLRTTKPKRAQRNKRTTRNLILDYFKTELITSSYKSLKTLFRSHFQLFRNFFQNLYYTKILLPVTFEPIRTLNFLCSI